MTAVILKAAAVIIGILFLILNFTTYVRKNLTEKFTWMWTVFGMFLILSGVVPGLSDWSGEFNSTCYVAAGLVICILVYFIFIITKEIAELKKRNKELAMHVSLLNQENERILARLEKLTGLTKSEI